MSTALILPTYGAFEYAFDAASTFLRARPHGRVYVVDDASPDAQADVWLQMLAELGGDVVVHRFPQNGGLTRSWNWGLNKAREDGVKYTVCGNSDLLFAANSMDALEKHADTYDVVGPVSNAPGWTAPRRQSVLVYIQGYKAHDSLPLIDEVGRQVAALNRAPIRSLINGFCMLARTASWWNNAFNREHVFDPSRRMTGNEDEFQRRLVRRGGSPAVVPGSFVFHYRSVSRPTARKVGLWCRKSPSSLLDSV